MSLIDLTGRTALVTGGSRGVGAATALMLAEAGAHVAFTYHSREADAKAVAERVANLWQSKEEPPQPDRPPARPPMIQADLSRREDCERAVAETVDAFGRLDIFVANAGIWPPEDVGVGDMEDERWRRTLAVNLDSVFYGCRAALRSMTPRRPVAPGTRSRGTTGQRDSGTPVSPARIVIVSSTAGQRGEAYHADYAATKGAIISFVKSLAVEAAPAVTVNAVAPGWIDTEMSMLPYERDGGEGRKRIEATIPMGRVATPEEVAGPIVFLCSRLADQVTGEIVNVNGGSVLCG